MSEETGWKTINDQVKCKHDWPLKDKITREKVEKQRITTTNQPEDGYLASASAMIVTDVYTKINIQITKHRHKHIQTLASRC